LRSKKEKGVDFCNLAYFQSNKKTDFMLDDIFFIEIVLLALKHFADVSSQVIG